MSTLFPGTHEHRVQTGDAEIFARIGGKGPPLLLVHGFPQTHAMWHRIAPELMRQFTCVLPDLRGYGLSSCPENTRDNRPYSKRAMAADLVTLMASLGHRKFAIAGHDRGARVTYRLALDHPGSVIAAAVLDIVPTLEMWNAMDAASAMNAYHWLFLAQPNPLPEMLIEQAPVGYLDYTLASWTAAKHLNAFHPDALSEYRTHYATPDHIHATCNDYRAGQTCDAADDQADLAAGRKIAAPLLAIWGDSGFPAKAKDPLAVWQRWASNVSGAPVKAGHFIAEENPQETLSHLLPFFAKHCGA
ncbi:alpha/beta hydrolase [soil metagenome]